jgi:hypothetical protein
LDLYFLLLYRKKNNENTTSTENSTEKSNTNVENVQNSENEPKPIKSPLLEVLERDDDGK